MPRKRLGRSLRLSGSLDPAGTVTPEKPDGMDDPCESELGDNSDAENRALNLRICCGD
jgi:hypothetical protein